MSLFLWFGVGALSFTLSFCYLAGTPDDLGGWVMLLAGPGLLGGATALLTAAALGLGELPPGLIGLPADVELRWSLAEERIRPPTPPGPGAARLGALHGGL